MARTKKERVLISFNRFLIFTLIGLMVLAYSPVLSVTSAATGSALSEKTTQTMSVGSAGDTLYYASSKSDKYHIAGCRYISLINPENLITFNSIQEAKAAGYNPCSVCIGSTPTPTPTPDPSPTPTPDPNPEPTPTPTPTPTPSPNTGNLTIHFIDVGQGDSILLEYGNHDMLVDAGEIGKGDDVEKYLKSKGITSLDYVVATHPHSDHIGGMSVILNDFPIAHFLDCGYTYTSKTYENMLTTIDKKNIPFTTPKRGEKIDFAQGIEIQVLNPGNSYFTDDVNQNSIALKVTDNKVSFLLMGDAGIEAENAIMQGGLNINADILKVGHHGSTTASGNSFINAVSPLVSVIEVGANNEYGHPHAETLQKLQAVSTVYRTDTAGTVTVTTDGSTYSVTTDKTTNTNPEKPLIPVAEFTANPLIGYSPLSVQFTDFSQNAVSRSWDFNNDEIIDSNDVNPSYTYTAPGTYIVNFTISNSHGISSKLSTITVQEGSSSNGGSGESTGSDGSSGGSGSGGSGGSGGGGAGGSPEPQSNVEIKELSQTFVTSGKPVKFEFPRNTTPIISVSFDSKKTAGKTTTIAELLKEKSTLTSDAPNGEVYKYLNIWVGTGGFATEKNIENAVVCFKVEKSWIQDKNMDKSLITLNRYNDAKWTTLTTNLSGEDDKYLYFVAQTPGFSPFAITGKMVETNENINKTQPQSENQGEKQVNTSNSTNAEQKEKTSTPGFEIIYGIIGLLGVFQYRRR